MRKRVLIVLGLVLGLGLAARLLWPREPSYKGVPLCDWVVRLNEDPSDAEARAVVHQLGSNSIPVLLDWLAREPRPLFRGRVGRIKDRTRGFLLAHGLLKRSPYRGWLGPKVSYRSLAVDAFTELGPDAKAAIPVLINRLAKRGPNPGEPTSESNFACEVLPKLAPASIPPLIEALSAHDEQLFVLAATALGEIGPEAKAALPRLQERLSDTNLLVRLSAADNFGKLGGAPALFMPVLLESLHDPDPTYLWTKLLVLRRHKEQARAAVPVLLDLLTNSAPSTGLTNSDFRDEVEDTLRKIAPEVLTTNKMAGGPE